MKEITVDAVTANIDKVTEFADEVLESYGCPVKVRMQIDIAIDEILSNIAYYAYGEQGGKVTVGFQIQDNPKMICVTFSDRGIPYNPLEKEDPDVSLSAEKRKIGGLGIYMVKKSMDEMSYCYSGGKNILVIKKIYNICLIK